MAQLTPAQEEEAVAYLAQHGVPEIVDAMVQSLTRERPEEIHKYLLHWMSNYRRKHHVLVTGGAGYIGSHTVLELVNAGYAVTVVDDLSNASRESLRRVGELTGKPERVRFFQADIRDPVALDQVFAAVEPVGAVIHFAAKKAVGESTQKPLLYFDNNVKGTLTLLEAMRKHNCKSIVFSSSATVYGTAPIPYTESSQVGVGIPSPYGQTKFMVEEILRDLHASNRGWRVTLLRYFNPVGAHPSGRIGEDPTGVPNNLMPFLCQVVVGKRSHLTVFGKDYPTADGTCRRDYLHVVDLAKGHLAALAEVLAVEDLAGDGDDKTEGFYQAYNLGSGQPTSVLELVRAMEKACGKAIPVQFGERRAGDLPEFWAEPSKAERRLRWKAERGVDEMCADSWRWQQRNPNGYHLPPQP